MAFRSIMAVSKMKAIHVNIYGFLHSLGSILGGDHFGQCAVEELSRATQGSLWPVCCGRAKLAYRAY